MKAGLSIAVLAVGSELLNGQVVDTNSNWIGEILDSHGLWLQRVMLCDDDVPEIKSSIELLLRDVDALVISGGLGPTADDVTREAVAQVFRKELVLNERELKALQDIFASRNREFLEANRRQVYFPDGARIIENPIGTAPGFSLSGMIRGVERTIFCLPGVPRELKLMFRYDVLQSLLGGPHASITVGRETLRIFGVPESKVGALVEGCNLGEDVRVAYRSNFPEIRVSLKADQGRTKKTDDTLNQAVAAIREAVGEQYIFSKDPEKGMPAVLQDLLVKKGLTLSVAESCTGGTLGMHLTELSGSSEYFMGGVITYSNQCKERLLEVDAKVLREKGAVSAEVAEMMAQGARKRCASDLALSITGIAGPEGGSPEKPVGTFYVGFAASREAGAFRYHFPGTREQVRTFAAFAAMDVARRYLLELPVSASPD